MDAARWQAAFSEPAMPLQLVLDEYDRIDVPLDDGMLEAWRLQFDRAAVTRNTYALSERLAACIAMNIAECLDWDLQLPTEKQVQFASAIARRLNVPLTGDALRYRGVMAEFINRFEATFRTQRIRRSRPGDALNSPPDD
jgi:hypothetical protein